jgi:hypothetical protein
VRQRSPVPQLADAGKKMEDRRKHDNEERLQGAIGRKLPTVLPNHDGATSSPR